MQIEHYQSHDISRRVELDPFRTWVPATSTPWTAIGSRSAPEPQADDQFLRAARRTAPRAIANFEVANARKLCNWSVFDARRTEI